MRAYDFFLEWRRESNPWREAYREGGGTFESTFLLCLVGFAALNHAGTVLGQRYGHPLSTRPTVLAGTLHAASTSAIAFGLIFVQTDDNDGDVDIALWQHVALPLSLAYFVADVFWYCVPRRDGLICFHHLVMCLCHYPVGHDAGAALAGAGNGAWVIWLSMMGYTSEVSTVLMNYRWYLLQTLERDWVGFAVVNILVALSWAARVVLFAYLLLFEVAPRAALYVEKKQVLTYIIMVVGHAVIGVLSVYWLTVMCRGGLRSLLTFQKREKGPARNREGVTFSFGEDIGRGGAEGTQGRAAAASGGANGGMPAAVSPRRVLRSGLEEARAWVDGTMFDGTDGGGEAVHDKTQ